MRPIFLLYLIFRNTNENLSFFKTSYLSKRNNKNINYYVAPPNLYELSNNNTIYNNSKNEKLKFKIKVQN